MTLVPATSGTAIDFTGIPSGIKMIVVAFNGISNTSTDPYIIQIGDAGGIEVTGYSSVGINAAAGSAGSSAGSSAGFTFASPGAAASTYFGHAILTLMDAATFLWAFSSNIGDLNQTRYHVFSGSKSTSQELDRIRITTTTGTPTFDAGSINVSYFR